MYKYICLLILILLAMFCAKHTNVSDMDREADIAAVLLKLTADKKHPPFST
jgi:hypothetical protein